MTGPQHYRVAESSLRAAAEVDVGSDKERYFLADAQVHATLALAAAVATAGISNMPIRDGTEWQATAGIPREEVTGP